MSKTRRTAPFSDWRVAEAVDFRDERPLRLLDKYGPDRNALVTAGPQRASAWWGHTEHPPRTDHMFHLMLVDIDQ